MATINQSKGLGITLKVEDNSLEALLTLEKRIPKAMYSVGLTAQQEIVDYMSRPDWVTGQDIVDTGRLRASISFITQNAESGGTMSVAESESNDVIKGRSGDSEVIIGSNVEYAAYVNVGTTKQPARRFMEHGLLENEIKIQQVFKDVLEGKK